MVHTLYRQRKCLPLATQSKANANYDLEFFSDVILKSMVICKIQKVARTKLPMNLKEKKLQALKCLLATLGSGITSLNFVII
jgi:hypothetical protein